MNEGAPGFFKAQLVRNMDSTAGDRYSQDSLVVLTRY
jgi:hypothetical protein